MNPSPQIPHKLNPMHSDNWWQIHNTDEIPTPSLLLYPDRIEKNLDRMIAWTDDPSKLRPHVKTHKLAEIVKMKLAKGITKFKAATIAECEMVASAGGQDVLLSMQIVGHNFHRFLKLMAAFPKVKFSSIVDDLTHFNWLVEQLGSSSGRLSLFIDLNVGMNRTGIAIGEPAMELCRHLNRLSLAGKSIKFEGIHAYDGHLGIPEMNELIPKSQAVLSSVLGFRDQLLAETIPVNSVVMSGTPTSHLIAAQRKENIEVSAGTTVLWDFGQQATCPTLPFLNAAVLMARVISRPSSDRICLDLGHKAVASEMPHPRVQFFGLEDAVPVVHSEEHLALQTPKASEIPIGTVFYGIPKHICPTVALHSHVWIVENNRVVNFWRVHARDRIITI
jgi:D-serine deaminase-like pyridoxal phosphate-dependent protein